MGLVMMKPVNGTTEPSTNSFFRLFATSHPKFVDEPQDQCHACLRNKLISFIPMHELQFTKVSIRLPWKHATIHCHVLVTSMYHGNFFIFIIKLSFKYVFFVDMDD